MNNKRYRITVNVRAAKSGDAAIRVQDSDTQNVTYHRAIGLPIGAEIVQEPGLDGAVVCLYCAGFVSRG